MQPWGLDSADLSFHSRVNNLDTGFHLINMKILSLLLNDISAWKMSKYGVFPGHSSPVLGQSKGIYSVYLRNQSKPGKIRTTKNSLSVHF